MGWIGGLLLCVAALNAAWDAFDARRAIEDGVPAHHGLLPGVANPWTGEVAEVSWAATPTQSVPKLPDCGLYLGGANGIVVIYDAIARRTWRFPSSAVVVTTGPDKKHC
jgi:hypothetical protein